MSDAPAATAPEIAREAAAELDLDGATRRDHQAVCRGDAPRGVCQRDGGH